jgi:hypothetical protein
MERMVADARPSGQSNQRRAVALGLEDQSKTVLGLNEAAPIKVRSQALNQKTPSNSQANEDQC